MDDSSETLLLPRGLILLASGWLIASWLLAIGVRAPVEPSSASYAPGVRIMLISMAVGLVVGWPLLRLSEPDTAFPMRRTILDLVVLLSLMQVVLWPLRLVTPWTPARTAALDATLIGWACVAGAVLAAASATRSVGARCGAVAVCVGMALGGPLLAWLGVLLGLPQGDAGTLASIGPLVETHQLAVAGSLPPTAAQWQWICTVGNTAFLAWTGLGVATSLRRRGTLPAGPAPAQPS